MTGFQCMKDIRVAAFLQCASFLSQLPSPFREIFKWMSQEDLVTSVSHRGSAMGFGRTCFLLPGTSQPCTLLLVHINLSCLVIWLTMVSFCRDGPPFGGVQVICRTSHAVSPYPVRLWRFPFCKSATTGTGLVIAFFFLSLDSKHACTLHCTWDDWWSWKECVLWMAIGLCWKNDHYSWKNPNTLMRVPPWVHKIIEFRVGRDL